MNPEESHIRHLKALEEVLEKTEGCLERVKTKRFTRTRKQQAFKEIDHVYPIDSGGSVSSP